MKYKMLVLDMDDTLLTDNHTISDENKTMIAKAQKKGVEVVLASGRPTPAMTQYANELRINYIISFNGAVVSDVKESTILLEQSLNKEQIHALYDFSLKSNTHIITYINNEIISETHSEFIEVERSITGLSHRLVTDFKAAITTNAVKCILLEDPAYLKKVEKELKATMPDLSISMSKPFFLEVAPRGVDKAASIQFLAKKLAVHQSEIIAVGNAGNDLTMIQYAGLGVWVANVDPELKSFGDVIVASNNDNGVAEVIARFILN